MRIQRGPGRPSRPGVAVSRQQTEVPLASAQVIQHDPHTVTSGCGRVHQAAAPARARAAGPTATCKDRKQLLRTLWDGVNITIHHDSGHTNLVLRWKGRAIGELGIPTPQGDTEGRGLHLLHSTASSEVSCTATSASALVAARLKRRARLVAAPRGGAGHLGVNRPGMAVTILDGTGNGGEPPSGVPGSLQGPGTATVVCGGKQICAALAGEFGGGVGVEIHGSSSGWPGRFAPLGRFTAARGGRWR
jgi:hypothetical protein